MKQFSTLVIGLLIFAYGYSQSVVEIIYVDEKGNKRSIKTNRPDTLIRKGTEVFQTANPSSSEQPIFKTASDSIQFHLIEKAFHESIDKMDAKAADSLSELLRKQYQTGTIGFRKVYHANWSFFSYDSLAQIKDRSSITRLSIGKLKSNRVPADVLTCKNLVELELVNTDISRIQRKLRKLPHLQTIYVINNKARQPLKLGKNANIKNLIFRGNNSLSLPKDFSPLQELTKLDLAKSTLVYFPRGLAKNRNLKELILTENALTLEEQSLPIYPSLEKLDLGKNHIKILPPTIGGFIGLKQLKFNNNSISTIPEEIGNLKKLEQLSFYNNQVAALPKGIYQLTSLKEIDLYYNQLKRLDSEVSQWKKLEVLYLAFNQLYSLPENLGELQTLEELYLHNNRLSEVPTSVGQLERLRVLRINNNLMTNLPPSLSRLALLENLDISNNNLTETPEKFFQFQKLKILSLVANPWDTEAIKRLDSIASKFRERGTIVNLTTFGEIGD